MSYNELIFLSIKKECDRYGFFQLEELNASDRLYKFQKAVIFFFEKKKVRK